MGEVTQQAKQWCKNHKMCRKCPFVTGKCVAPAYGGQKEFDEWIKSMNQAIAEEVKHRASV